MKILFLTNNEISLKLFEWLNKNEEVRLYSNLINCDDIRNIDFIISYNYKHIIAKEIIQMMPKRIINLHISYLPYNRGAMPNIWSIIDNTPKGVTIHYIDDGLDTGEVIFQKEITLTDDDTLKTSYNKLHDEIQMLFKQNWNNIKNGYIKSYKQKGEYTMHTMKDFKKIEKIITSWNMTIKDFKMAYNEIKKEKE